MKKEIIAILETETSFICETLESNEIGDGVNHLIEFSKELASGISKVTVPTIDIDEFKALPFIQARDEKWPLTSGKVQELLKTTIINSGLFLAYF